MSFVIDRDEMLRRFLSYVQVETTSDEACSRAFIERVGRRLFRRSLTQVEADARVEIANQSANALRDFYAGLELGLMSLLVSPQ